VNEQNSGWHLRPDSALSHLYEDEMCVVTLKDGTQHEMRWDKEHWRFVDEHAPTPGVCEFDDISEWRPASIRH
jgi:hypothetical protein